MTGQFQAETCLRDIVVPRSLVANVPRFGGRPDRDCLRGDLMISEGVVVGMQGPTESGPVRMVLPKLTEPHVHLDKCHTVDRLPSVGGDLSAAIAAQFDDKQRWTPDDIRARAKRGLMELAAAGCRVVRSHVDWEVGPDPSAPPTAWSALEELAQDLKGEVELQLAPLINTGDLTCNATVDQIAKVVAWKGGAMGCFVLSQPDRGEAIERMFRAADRFGMPLDFHVDEGLAPGLDGLSLIAETAIKTGFQGPVLCSHACSLMNLRGDALNRVIDKVAKAGLIIATLPTTNLYLQGRDEGTPDRRGLTRVQELRRAGVVVVVGSDNVRDAFCPIGRHDPMASLAVATLTAHLDPPLGQLLPMITTDASRALGVDSVHVDGAAVDDLLIVEVQTVSELLAGSAQPHPVSSHSLVRQPARP